jgi:type IV secretory pathway VirB4 component
VRLGADRLGEGGAFSFDPFDLYAARVLTNPNMLVLGEPGSGKSAAVKVFCARLARSGRPTFLAIADPKGEYGPLATALGLAMVKLHPGGVARLNPLDPGPGCDGAAALAARRAALLQALLGTVMRRPLRSLEEAALCWAVETLEQAPAVTVPTLADVAALLASPTPTMTEAARRSEDELARELDDVRLGMGRLLDRDLRGMFDGASTVRTEPDSPGVVLDLSALHHDSEALALVMVAASAWLQGALAAPAGEHGQRRVQVLDEAWALLAAERTARYLQAAFKLCRSWGVANIAISHRVSDLRAQADDGTATAKIGEGLLADTQTRVFFRQAADQLRAARELLGLTDTQAGLLPRLGQGCALWMVGGRAHLVEHHIDADWDLCDTDGAMLR